MPGIINLSEAQEKKVTKKPFAINSKRFIPKIRLDPDLQRSVPVKMTKRFINLFAGIHMTIRAKILLSLCIVILLMGTANVLVVIQMMNYSRQYDAIINNITTANSISGSIKPDIDNEMWNIVAGKTQFNEGKQYEIINNINNKIQWMMENTDSQKAKVKLDVVLRTMQTLTQDVDMMGGQIAKYSTATQNEAVLEKIRFVTGVVEGVVQDYVLFEVNRTNGQYQQMRAGFIEWEILAGILTFGAISFSVVAAWALSRSIYTPIKKLHDVTKTITQNDLQALVTGDNVDEITELGMSFNIMIGKIRELLDSKIKEQENLKKAEMRALQSQINPHFLYNTLDTIIWMAESKKTDQIVEVVSALSNFFRISLSKGKDWITIGEEVERVKSYLTIQKIRYRDIMDFKIEVDEKVSDHTVLKLILQPLVENAIYHGIKNKREGGTIFVRAKLFNGNKVLLEVEDTGIGFTPQILLQLQTELADNSGDIKSESGFGIGNVNQRIKLYYGLQYGLSVKSEYQKGTCVSFIIPARNADSSENQVSLPADISVQLPHKAIGSTGEAGL
jgi:two-component system sensor histidine kinase YesM